jgi:hypothetical protein
LKNFSFGAGGYYSTLRQANVTVKFVDNKNTQRPGTFVDVRNFKERFDAGMSLYMGYSIGINEKNWTTLRLTYNKGLVDIHDGWNEGQRNNSLIFSAAFSLKNPFRKHSIFNP